MANYTSQAAIEARIGRSLTASEITYLTQLLPSIDAYINSQTGTSFLPPDPDNDVIIYEEAECSSTLVIPTMRSVTQVRTSSGFTDDFQVLAADQWRKYPRTGAILALKKNGTWGEGVTVEITGKLGYATVPADVASIAADLAVSAIIASSVASGNSGNYKSERVGDWQVTYADAGSSSSNSGIASISASSLNTLHGYNRLSRSI